MYLSENGRLIKELFIHPTFTHYFLGQSTVQEGVIENKAQQRILYFRSGKFVSVVGKSPV